jgi:hypothetical protein
MPRLGAAAALELSTPGMLGARLGAVLPWAAALEPVLLGTGDMTELPPLPGELLPPLPDELALDEADPEVSGLAVGSGCPVGCWDGCGAEAVADGSLDAEAEAGCAGETGGVGPAHTVDLNVKALWVAALPELELEAGTVVSVGAGLAEPLGLGVGAVVGVMLGEGVGRTGTVGVADGAAGIWSCGVGLTFGGLLAAGVHVALGVGLAAVTFPFPCEPGAEPGPPGSRWPLPLLLAPPVPVLDVVPPVADDVMLPIACRNSGTAMAVPANRQTAATARTGRSQAVPNRW